jgi:hypothetical protein
MVTVTGRVPAARGPAAALLGCALLLGGCDLLTVTPFPAFLGYTDMSKDLASAVERVWDKPEEVSYQLEVVYTDTDAARVLLVIEPPSDSGGDYEYRGEMLMLDEDLNTVARVRPPSDLDFFARPFAYGHQAGVILVSNMLITSSGQPFDVSLTYLGLEGPAIADRLGTAAGSPATYLFAPPPGEFATFDLTWQSYFQPSTFPATIWSFLSSGTLPILPAGSRPSGQDAGYQILDAVYNSATDEVTFLFSEPAEARVVAARALLSEIVDGTVTSLAGGAGSFPIDVEADRPLDARADTNGFFLRRREGVIERCTWTATGALRLVGEPRTLVGDRSFDRRYAFLAGNSPSGRRAMYRFDPASRVLTRYKRWW